MPSKDMILGALALTALMLFTASSGIAQDITEGLVLYLAFDEADAGEIKDLSGKGNNAAVKGQPEWVEGRINQGLRFVADQDHLQIPFSETLIPEKAMSMAVWVNFDGVDKLPSEWGGVIIDDYKWDAEAANVRGYFLGIEKQHVRACFLGVGTSEHCFVLPHPPAGQWAHMAITYDGKEIRGYMNGEAQKDKWTGEEAVKWDGPIGTNDVEDLFIASKEGQLQGYPGVLDELALYDRGLTQEEVKLLMDKGITAAVGPADKLASAWGALKAK